jgi:aminoglycoside 6'-N-acetyltransferase
VVSRTEGDVTAPSLESPPVALRPMTHADFGDLLRWRREPHVACWFAETGPVTPDLIEQRYGPRIRGDDPTRMFVVTVDERPVGFLQDYRIKDHPGFAVLAPEPDAIGVDYSIGEPTWIRRGVGLRMLRRWFDVARAGYPDAATYFAAPDHRNIASRRLLLKAGFVEGIWFDEPQRDGSTATVVGHCLDVPSVLG